MTNSSGGTGAVNADPALLAAVRQALAMPAAHGDVCRLGVLTSLSADSNPGAFPEGAPVRRQSPIADARAERFSNPGHLTDLSPLSGLTNLKSLTLQDCGMNDTRRRSPAT